VCKAEKKHRPDLGPVLNESLAKLTSDQRKKLRGEFETALYADMEHLKASLNFDHEIVEELSAFDPDERKKPDTKARMLRVASKTKRFDNTELLDLGNEITAYINIDNDKIPKFTAHSRLDSDFYVKIWNILKDSLTVPPLNFVRLTKVVLTLSHGQATIERGFSDTRMICQRGLMTQKTVEGQKRTKDLIKEYGGALNVPLTKSLLTHVSTANSTWKKHLDDEKKKEEIRKLDKLQADTE
jgi:hypothetical protein